MADDLFSLPAPGDRQLRLVIQTPNRVLARDIGDLLISIDKAFSRFVRENYGRRGVRLRIVNTGTGSWWALFEQAGVMYDLGKDRPDVIAAFQGNLDYVVNVLRTHGPEDTPQYLRALIRDMIKAGRAAVASVVQIGATHMTEITAKEFNQLDATIKVYNRAPPPAVAHSDLKLDVIADDVPRLAYAGTIRDAGFQAARGELFAVLLKVEDKWYARTQGMHGVLIPVEVPEHLSWSLLSGTAYQIDGGLINGPEGYPIAVHIRSLSKIG